MNHYETVFILNPVLSDDQIKETVKKYEDFLVSKGAKMVSKEDWGLKKLAYPIQNKKSGFYHLFEYTAPGEAISLAAPSCGKRHGRAALPHGGERKLGRGARVR